MSALFTDHNRKCIHCGARAGVWPDDERGVATCPSCGKPQERENIGYAKDHLTKHHLSVSEIDHAEVSDADE